MYLTYMCCMPVTPNLPTNIVGFGWFASSVILNVRGGIPRPIGNFLESLSRAILLGIMLVGRLCVWCHTYNCLIWSSESLSSMKHRSAPKEKCPSVCSCGDPWGTLLQLEIGCSWAPVKPPRGQKLRSPRPKVPCAYPTKSESSNDYSEWTKHVKNIINKYNNTLHNTIHCIITNRISTETDRNDGPREARISPEFNFTRIYRIYRIYRIWFHQNV